jgi:hypothetical protein
MALFGAIGEVRRQGKEVETGEVTLDETNPTEVSTPFARIDAVFVTLQGSDAPGLDTSVVTYVVDGNKVEFYAWEPTSSSNPTLVASDSQATISYTIIGRRRGV